MAFVSLLWLAIISAGCGADPGLPSQFVQTTTPPPTPAPMEPPPPPPTHDVRHVFLVVEENKNYSDVVGSSDMPYLNSLIQKYAVASNFYANGLESLPNYFMLTTGDTISKDASYSGTVTQDNIVRELTANKKTWKVYAESLPSVGYLGPDQPPYIRVHNPFTYFSEVKDSSEQRNNIVPFTRLAADLAAGALPDYGFIVPNNSSNSHDCPPDMPNCDLSDTLQYADQWLKTNVAPLLANADFQDHGLLIITWDESRTDVTVNGGGHVATVLVGATVKPGFTSSTLYQHQSTLRLTMRLLGLKSYPAQAASAPDMDEFFTEPLP